MDKTINEIREILFKYLDIQQVPDIMNDIRGLLNKPDNNSIPLDAEVKPACETLKIIDEMIREWEESTFDISVKQALTELKRRLEKQWE